MRKNLGSSSSRWPTSTTEGARRMRVTEWRKSSYSGGGGSSCVEVAWRKSSFSGGGGSDCVEVAWRKSSYSQGGGTACVEVALGQLQTAVRNSKNTGPELRFPATSWHTFLHQPLSG